MKDMNQRLLVTLAICLGIMMAYNYLFPPPKRPGQPPSSAQTQTATQPGAPAPQPSTAPKAADVPRETPAATAQPRPPSRTFTLQTSKVKVVVASDGAAVQSAQLLGDKYELHPKGEPSHQVELVNRAAGGALPFSTTLRRADGSIAVPSDAAYELVKADERFVELRTTAGGVTLTKTLSLDPATYKVDLSYRLQSAQAFDGQLAILFASHSEEPHGSFLSPSRVVPARSICAAANNKVERLALGAKTPTWSGTQAQFAGVDEQYFLTAALAPEGVPSTCALEVHETGEKQGVVSASLDVPVHVEAGQARDLSLVGFVGPKDTDALVAVAKPLREAVDFGFWSIIADLLLVVMKFFHRVVPGHNWGVAIILLTLAMKALTFPLQHKSMKSMQEMARIQPQLEEIKKKYAGDQQRQNLEQMKLFKEHGVNPMGSCLPMLIQMPIWFALYTTLQVSVELYNAPFIHGWLNDLTARDPYYILPVAMGITMVATQVLTPTPMQNPSQKNMGYVMSIFFSFLMLTLPSGLTLYIFTNNVLSIIQQMYLRRTLKPPTPPASGQVVEVGRGAARARA